MFDTKYALWSIWLELPMLLKLFVLILTLVSIHTLVSSSIILVRLHSLAKRRAAETASSLRRSVFVLQIRVMRMRQLVGATFYLFGFVFFLTLPLAIRTLGDGPRSPLLEIWDNFVVQFAFAANVFLIFLLLHSVQWVASTRVHAYMRDFSAASD